MPGGMMEMLEENFKEPMGDRDPQVNYAMAAFYIRHNTGIGLRCFAWGILIIPGLQETLFNALVLGAAFGYMGRPDVPAGANFFNFVTAHGPFELTAIVLSAGAGLRLGMGWLKTNGLTRAASLQKTAAEAMPMMGSRHADVLSGGHDRRFPLADQPALRVQSRRGDPVERDVGVLFHRARDSRGRPVKCSLIRH